MRRDAREAAYKILYAEHFNDNPSEDFRKEIFAEHKLNEKDIAFAENLLGAIAENGEEINENSLDIIWKANQKISIFELPKAITSKNAKKAFGVLESLLEQNEEPMAILGVISSEYNDIYRAKLFLESGENPAKLAEFFDYKNKEFRIKNTEKTAKRLDFENIKKIISKLAKADLELKTSSSKPKTILFETVAYILENLN